MVPLRGQQGFGWLAVLVLFLASAFGIKANEQSPYKWRAVSLCGMLVMYAGVWLFSAKRSHVKARPIILGLCMQVILGLFVFKTVRLSPFYQITKDHLVEITSLMAGSRSIVVLLDVNGRCRFPPTRNQRRSSLLLERFHREWLLLHKHPLNHHLLRRIRRRTVLFRSDDLGVEKVRQVSPP